MGGHPLDVDQGGDHGRATFLMRTGYLPTARSHYPTLGSLVSKEIGDP